LLALAALCLNIREDAQLLQERLRLSNGEERRLARAAEAFVTLHGLELPPSRQGLLLLLFRFGRTASQDALLLACAEARAANAAAWQTAIDTLPQLQTPLLRVSGSDFLARGIPNGRAVGAALKDLQARWIAAGFPEEPEHLEQLIAAAVKAAREKSAEKT
jgi:poly(A) polymerase